MLLLQFILAAWSGEERSMLIVTGGCRQSVFQSIGRLKEAFFNVFFKHRSIEEISFSMFSCKHQKIEGDYVVFLMFSCFLA